MTNVGLNKVTLFIMNRMRVKDDLTEVYRIKNGMENVVREGRY